MRPEAEDYSFGLTSRCIEIFDEYDEESRAQEPLLTFSLLAQTLTDDDTAERPTNAHFPRQ